MLLEIHLEIGPPAKIVHYFEIIKEKWPSEEIPFAKIVKVGAAYHEMGEYERSYLVFRATVESNFARESEVAGFLESQGELLRSVEAMSGLLRNYPPEGYVAAATYSLAQQVAAKAPEAANDPKLRQQKVNRVDLLHRAWTMLEGFLTAWPDDPAADQAAFASASTLLDLKAYREVGRGLRPLCQALCPERPGRQLLVHHRLLRIRPGPAQGGPGDVPEGGRVETPRQGHRPRSGKPEQVAGDLHPGPGLSRTGRGGRRHPRVSPRGRPFCRRQGGDRLLPPQGDRTARGDDGQAGRGGRSGTEVPQHRRAAT